ncbi:unnamed protein product, partial [Mesorhabditis belari]|uniref:CXXC motif containing zinc binding protein n=1 Tax=Mesorhabditis belari TaxID=2138241 RepID=A0AAF3FS91_9BILA
MPILSLDLKANLVNLTNLRPSDPESFRWHIKVRCTNCGEAPDSWHYIVINERMDIPGSRGEANLVEKCKLCSRVNTLTIVDDSVGSYSAEKNEQFQSMIKFDCRGLEPYEFDPRMGWQAEGVESETPFEEIDLSEKEWSDYDERVNEAVEINEIDVKFNFVRGK